MKRFVTVLLVLHIIFISGVASIDSAAAAPVNKIKQADASHDPFGVPRPGRFMRNVPLKTSFYTELYVPGGRADSIDFNSIEVKLIPEGEPSYHILKKNQTFPKGYHGRIKIVNTRAYGDVVSIYVDSDHKLKPNTLYTVKIDARTKDGYGISAQDGSWKFTTGFLEDTYDLSFAVDFSKKADVNWQGRYFNGILRPDFDTFETYGTERFDYMYSESNRKAYPDAWNIFRDFSITDTDYYNIGILQPYQPNAVREKETRRITSIQETPEGILLYVEDFFGHEQYGIESNRPLSEDYKADDEILIADGVNSKRAKVISTNDANRTVLVTKFTYPSEGWELDYLSPLPTKEDPRSPGLFPKGGTYLYKFNPSGTPVYYWGRIDHQYDRLHNVYEMERIAVNFNQAPGDLSIDGGSWTAPKDYIQHHKVVYDMTCHLIDRYGDATLSWIWSVFNEPDLSVAFWRINDWMELQKFYDYTSDAILKAFEDKGYDSNDVFIGGLELGAIFGTNLRLHEFLAHCSPTAERDDALSYNAAYKDPGLDGKRSRRVEELCSANNGKGAPLDFISIHSYNSSEVGAAKIIRAKEIALEIDPLYYKDLWISNFESVPCWDTFNDPGCAQWTFGNGYFPTWAADYFTRLLQKAREDSRYSYGEGVITTWGMPQSGFNHYLNDVVMVVKVRDGRTFRNEVVPKPIFHYINLMSTMKTDYWVLPQVKKVGHTVSGFAAPGEDDLRIMLYSHNRYDSQSRADHKFNIDLNLQGLDYDEVLVTEYMLDKEHNTMFPYAEENINQSVISEMNFKKLKELTQLKATRKTKYRVKGDGSLKVKVPLRANGVNFIVLSDGYGVEIPTEAPIETPYETPIETGSETPDEPDESQEPTDKDDKDGMDNGGNDSPKTGDKSAIATVFNYLLFLLSSCVIIRALKPKHIKHSN